MAKNVIQKNFEKFSKRTLQTKKILVKNLRLSTCFESFDFVI